MGSIAKNSNGRSDYLSKHRGVDSESQGDASGRLSGRLKSYCISYSLSPGNSERWDTRRIQVEFGKKEEYHRMGNGETRVIVDFRLTILDLGNTKNVLQKIRLVCDFYINPFHAKTAKTDFDKGRKIAD